MTYRGFLFSWADVVNEYFDLLIFVAFFGGPYLGFRLNELLKYWLLRHEPVLNKTQYFGCNPQLHRIVRHDVDAQLVCVCIGGVLFLLTFSRSTEAVLLLGGLVVALWTELPLFLFAVLDGIWLIPDVNRKGSPDSVIVTGRTRLAGWVGVGLTAAATGIMFGLATILG